MADLVEKLTRAISPRDEPRMWEYYRMEKTLGLVGVVLVFALMGLLVWWIF